MPKELNFIYLCNKVPINYGFILIIATIGFGQKLMEEMHKYGCELGCTMATVATMSFQNARAFYEKLGYVVDFERHGYAQNTSCIFLKKELHLSA